MDGCDHGACVAVETIFCTVVTDLTQSIANDTFYINISACGDFTHYENDTCCGACFAGNSCFRVFCQDCVQNGVGDLVTDLVGMSFCYGLRCE